MRSPYYFLALLWLTACGAPVSSTIIVYRTNTAELGLVVDGEQRGTWTVSPAMRPDVYAVPCKQDSAVVELTGAERPIRYVLLPGDTVDFVVLLGADSAHTRFIGVPWTPAASFGPAYRKANAGQWSVEIPEVQELMLIAIALTPTGLADSNMIGHEGPYYRAMLEHFAPKRDSALNATIEGLLTTHMTYFAPLMMDANAFHFNGGRLVADSVYDRLSWGEENLVRAMVPDLERFARNSDFRSFFASHTAYYDSLRTTTRAAMPVDAMWRWLEERFPARYANYRVIISPLIEGFHCTNRFSADGFDQSVMFICPAYSVPGWSPGLIEGQNSRIVFTEIDHNYVNPVSDGHVAGIAAAFADLPKWASEEARGGYGNAYSVFNEYMTFGVFMLYAQEKLAPKDHAELRKRVVDQMENARGFPRFGAFLALLEKVYADADDKRIAPLYPAVLAGCASL